jgi:hypothetical protein
MLHSLTIFAAGLFEAGHCGAGAAMCSRNALSAEVAIIAFALAQLRASFPPLGVVEFAVPIGQN